MAAQPVWFRGSGGAGKTTPLLSRHFWQSAPVRERRSRFPLQSVGGTWFNLMSRGHGVEGIHQPEGTQHDTPIKEIRIPSGF